MNASLAHVLQHKEPHYLPVQRYDVAGPDGRFHERYWRASNKPVFSSNAEIACIIHTAEDITGQIKAAEMEKQLKGLKESEDDLISLVLKAPIGICVLDAATLVTTVVNESFFEISGLPEYEIVGRMFWEIFPEVRSSYKEALNRVVRDGITFRAHEVNMNFLWGQPEAVNVTFIYNPVERTKELGQTNEALQRINKELQRSNQNLEEFAHAASHDLKEPVRKIHFFTNQLKSQISTQLQEGQARALNRIENASQRMGNLIDDLLLYSHVSQRPHEKENVDLNKKVQNALEDLEIDIEEKRAIINLEQLPVVNGYRRQLQQLFQNLISNAVKYSREDEPPRIDITAQKVREGEKNYYLIRVKDNGIGFQTEYADKIFQMFSRLHGKNEYSGTGVGLSIVKKVVENHNGFIGVESEVGSGSVFKVYLPV